VQGSEVAALPRSRTRVNGAMDAARLVATTGTSPCGAALDFGNVGEVEHEHGCPAVTKTLATAIRRWIAAR
jgi:hypothetical protein